LDFYKFFSQVSDHRGLGNIG